MPAVGVSGPSRARGSFPNRTVHRHWFVLAVALAIVVPLATAFSTYELLSSRQGPPPNLLPSAAGQTVLTSGSAKENNAIFAQFFSVPASAGPGNPVKIEAIAWVNVSCAGPANWSGIDYVCSWTLINNPTTYVWHNFFTGEVVSNATTLLPGSYSLYVHVEIGKPPLPAELPPFDASAEVAVIN